MRHTDATPGWIKRRFAKIEKQMREDRAAKKLQAATIGKGGLRITEGGSFSAVYPNGQAATRFGPYTDSSGNLGYGLFVYDEAGNILFGAIRYPNLAFQVVESDAAFTARGDFVASPTAGPEGFAVIPNGGVTINGGTTGTFITHSTTGASANCFIDPSDGRIWRSTSSRRYKQDIEDAEVDPGEVLQLRPRTWRDKGEVENEPETTQRYAGLIAEEVDELPTMRQFVTRKDGEPEAVDYDRLSTVALLAVVKDQQARIEALESADEAPAEP